jgi:membrane protease YdiL (CAAX protease family)
VETAGALGGVAPGATTRGAWPRRIAALLEVVGVFVGGTLVARAIGRALDLGPANLRSLPPGTTPDFVALSVSSAANLVLRYSLVLGLAFAVGWWHRKRRLAQYGVTLASRPVSAHFVIGVLLFAATGILPLGIRLLSNVMPMGRAPAHWALVDDLSLPGVWLYLFVGSFGLVPVVEELLARGYIQSRLSEDFGAPTAILITASFFTFSHTQYFIPSAIGVGMLASLFLGSIGGGYVRYRTGSLLPGIVAHALGNLPYRGWVATAVLAAMILIVGLCARPVYVYAAAIWKDVLTREAIIRALAGIAVLVIVLAFVLAAPPLLPGLAVAALGAALTLELRDRRT